MHELAPSLTPPVAMHSPSMKSDGVSPANMNVGIDRCIELLNGKSDEEKFAGLLLVTKTTKSDDPVTMGRVLQAVSLPFIYRLLISPGGAADATDGSNLYQFMALHVLSCFCALPELLGKLQDDSTFLRMAKPLVALLDTEVSGQDLENLLRCLFSVATTQAGQERLCSHKAPLHLTRLFQRRENDDIRTSIANVLDHVTVPDLAPEATAEAVPEMAKVLNKSRGMAKIDMLPRLAAVLSSEEDRFVRALAAQGDSWHADMRGGLMELLRNRLGGEHRVNILRCALFMCEKFGQEWAVPETNSGAGGGVDGTFVQLLMAFCKLDLRLRLEEAEKPPDNQQAVPVGLALLEKALTFLTEGGEEEEESDDAGEGGGRGEGGGAAQRAWFAMDPERLLYMRSDLEESMEAVMTYLEDHQAPADDPLVLGMSRLVCLWSMEVQSDAFSDRLCAAWPSLTQGRGPRGAGGAEGEWALQWMLPALPVVLQEARVCDAFARAGGQAALAQMLLEATGTGEGKGEGLLGGQEEEAWEALGLVLKRDPEAPGGSGGVFARLVEGMDAGRWRGVGGGEGWRGMRWEVTVGMQVLRGLRRVGQGWWERAREQVEGLAEAVVRNGGRWEDEGLGESVRATVGAARKHAAVKRAVQRKMEAEGGGGGRGKGGAASRRGGKAMEVLRQVVAEAGGEEEERRSGGAQEEREELKEGDGVGRVGGVKEGGQRRAMEGGGGEEGGRLPRLLTAEERESGWAVRRDQALEELAALRLKEEAAEEEAAARVGGAGVGDAAGADREEVGGGGAEGEASERSKDAKGPGGRGAAAAAAAAAAIGSLEELD